MGINGLHEIRAKINTHGIRLHGGDYGKIGDKVIAIKNITSSKQLSILKGSEHIITDILVESQEGNGLGFSKKIIVSGLGNQIFNPQRFRKNNL